MSKRILFIEPYYGGSHRSWFEQLQRHSEHSYQPLTLPGKHWKWRMHSSASIFSDQVNQLNPKDFDLILCSEFLSINRFRGELNGTWRDIPIACYFHENQILYPWSQHDKESAYERNLIYVYHNLENLRAADKLVFNSNFHLNSLIDQLPKVLITFPSPKPVFDMEAIKQKSIVLPPGIEDEIILSSEKANQSRPLILWNHRWDEDKNPKDFFRLIEKLRESSFKFRLALLGNYSNSPYKETIESLPSELIAYSGFQSREQYIKILNEAAITPITSHHDFFGISAVEAILTGSLVFPPDRMAYHEHFESSEYEKVSFTYLDELIEKVITYQNYSIELSKQSCERYLWSNLVPLYDSHLSNISM